MVVVSLPSTLGASRRERRLRAVLSRWMSETGCPWRGLEEEDRQGEAPTGEIPVGLLVVKGREDLRLVEVFRNRFPHARWVSVVLSPQSDLLLALQRFSPSFMALSETDDAALPEVLERLLDSSNR